MLMMGTHIPLVRRGFSLIELVMVLTIISIMGAVAIPRYADALARYRIEAAARRLIADLDYAREYARAKSASVTVQVQPATDRLLIVGVPSLNDLSSDWVTDLTLRPYQADIDQDNFPGHQVTFDGFGTPSSGGDIQIIVGSQTRLVRLDPDTGKAAIP